MGTIRPEDGRTEVLINLFTVLVKLLQFGKQSKQKVELVQIQFRRSYKAINWLNLKTLVLAFGSSVLLKSFS